MDIKRGIARAPVWQSVGIKRNIGRQVMATYAVLPANDYEILVIDWRITESNDKFVIEQPAGYHTMPILGFRFRMVDEEKFEQTPQILGTPIVPIVQDNMLNYGFADYALRKIGTEKVYAGDKSYVDACQWFSAFQQRYPQRKEDIF
jgi:hypothetical protein